MSSQKKNHLLQLFVYPFPSQVNTFSLTIYTYHFEYLNYLNSYLEGALLFIHQNHKKPDLPPTMVNSKALMVVLVFFGLCLVLGLAIALPLILIPPSCPKLRMKSDTTILLNFTGSNLTLGGNIGLDFYNPNYNVHVFYNTVSVSVFYNVNDDHNPNPAATGKFLVSTYLSPVYMSVNDWVRQGISIDGARSTVNNSNTIDVGRAGVKFLVRLSSPINFHGSRLFLHHRKGCLINFFCYPLTSHVSTSNATNISTTVLLSAFSC